MTLTQEQKLKELLNSIAPNPQGYIAVHINVSKIAPHNKPPQKIKIAMTIIEKNINLANSHLFVLSNDDIILVTKSNLLKNVYNSIEEIKKLFANDLVLINGNPENFAQIISFDFGFEDFRKKILTIIEEVDAFGIGIGDSSVALTPEALDKMTLALGTADVSPYIKKQEVIAIGSENIGKMFFQEYYISLNHLKQALGFNVNLLSDKWLFHHLSEVLDKKMLTTLTNLNLDYDGQISLNLNLKSIESVEFKSFMHQYKKPMTIELQISDIFEDIKYYEKIRAFLQSNGHKIAIDSVNDETLKLLDLKLLSPDYVKITWNNGYIQNQTNIKAVQEIVNYIGSNKIILCRCPDEDAVKWGLTRGITIYQGHFIDTIVGAMIKKQCKININCDIKDCIARRHFASPGMQRGCDNISHLNKNPQIKMGL